MSARWPRPLVAALDMLNRRGAGVAVRLTRYTGKSAHAVHPKHLSEAPWHHWYAGHLEPSDLVLDLGCSNGAHALVAARRVRRVVGVDYDRAALAVAADGARRAGCGNLCLLAVDLTGRLPFRDASFDAVLFLDVIEHLEPRRHVLSEIGRVLTPDGRLLISAPNRETSWRRRLREAGLFAFSDPDHKVEYSEEELLAELRAGGFAPDGPVMPVVYDTAWAGVIDVIGGVSLTAYRRLSAWKRRAALRRPAESIGFRLVARRFHA
jgi:SAM-dependent methyltransferase